MTDLRATILDLLSLFASDERQLAYEQNTPSVDLASEMQCLWFDDLYHPDDMLFQSSFSSEERSALSRFSQFYRERVFALTGSRGTIRDWLVNSVWKEVMEKARQTLASIV